MRLEVSEYFSKEYKAVYKVYHKNEGRYMANLIGHDGNRKTISYAKYVYMSYHKTEIAKGEQIDHINGDKTDDRIENLQKIEHGENNLKSKMIKEKVLLTCPVCKSEFLLDKRNVPFRPNPTCSKKCGGIKSHWNKVKNITERV